MKPVFEIVGTQVRVVQFKIDDHRQLVEREKILRFFVEHLLQVEDVVTAEVYPGTLAKENVAATIEGDDVSELVLLEVFHQEVPDGHFGRVELLEGVLQLHFFHTEIFFVRFAPAGFEVDHLFGSADGMPQLVDFGIHIDDFNVGVVHPTFEKDSVGTGFKDQKGNFADGVEVWVSAVDVAIL